MKQENTANNLKEAENFFLTNSKDNLICIKGEEKKECKCYPEALEFFEEKNEKSNKISNLLFDVRPKHIH